MSLKERMKSPTPPFFARLRNVGIVLTVLSGVLMTTPVALPVIVIKIAGYLAVAGAAASAVSQAVVADSGQQ